MRCEKPIRHGHGFPLIVFSHGFGASGPAYAFLLEMFVREGYVIAAPTFPLSSGGAPGGPAGAASRQPKPPAESFEVGDFVDHKAFGRGRVTSVKGDALEICFDRTGETKKLLVGYAPIVKLKS